MKKSTKTVILTKTTNCRCPAWARGRRQQRRYPVIKPACPLIISREHYVYT